MSIEHFDVAIIGGGPAGLNAALILGRSRRRVVLIDEGLPRNRVTHASHGFLTRDGIRPEHFRQLALEELQRYPGIVHVPERAGQVEKVSDGFIVITGDGQRRYKAGKLLLATGLRDRLPPIKGLPEIYGQSAFTCPYCDGWELSDEPLAIIADGAIGLHMAQVLTGWSRDLILCTNGGAPLSKEDAERLHHYGIHVNEQPIAGLESENGILKRIVWEDGTSALRRAAFVFTDPEPASDVAMQLGAKLKEDGSVETDEMGKSSIPNLYVAGDGAHIRMSNLVIAAADGVKAAVAINTELIHERLEAEAQRQQSGG